MWKLEPARKLDHAAGRTVTLNETWQRLRPVMVRVPISRVSDLTPLDRIGLPTFSAVTPLAHDLTTHMGKGASREAARISALMEALERVSAEQEGEGNVLRARFETLGDRAADPENFDLPLTTNWKSQSIHWVEGWDLLQDRPAYLARDLIISPPAGELLSVIDTNGLASGNTLLEAVTHALCELIERDAVSQMEFRSAFSETSPGVFPAMDLNTVPEPLGLLIEPIEAQGLELALHNITTDIQVPSFRAMIIDRHFPGTPHGQALYSPGYGTHPDCRVAASRAITEAVQARVGFIQGARDSFNAAPFLNRSARQALERQLAVKPDHSFDDLASHRSSQLMDDLNYLLKCLRRIGIGQCLVADLTREQWQVPVVRLRVPGLSHFLIHPDHPGHRCLRHLI